MKVYTKYQCNQCGKIFKENKIYFFLDLPGMWQCPNCAHIQYLSDTDIKTRVDYTK